MAILGGCENNKVLVLDTVNNKMIKKLTISSDKKSVLSDTPSDQKYCSEPHNIKIVIFLKDYIPRDKSCFPTKHILWPKDEVRQKRQVQDYSSSLEKV